MKRWGVFSLLLVVWGCSDRYSGGAGSETNSGLTARLLDTRGRPAQSVAYRIRPSWYVRADSASSARDVLPLTQYADGVSDSHGRFELEKKLADGSYILEVEGDSAGVLYPLEIRAQDSTKNLGDIALRPLGRVSGIVPLPHGVPVRLRLYGTERLVWTDSAGRFSLDRLPPGQRLLRVDHPSSGRIYSELKLPEADTVVNLDTIPMRNFAFDAATWAHWVRLPLARALRDSLYESSPEWSGLEMPLLFMVDRDLVDFSLASPVGADIRVTDAAGNLLPMQMRYWDPVAGRGFFWVRGARGDLKLYYGKPGASSADSIEAVWRGWSAEKKTALTRILVDNFEDGDLTNQLPGSLPRFNWYRGRDSLSIFVDPPPDSPAVQMIRADSTGRSGKVLRLRYAHQGFPSWVLVGCLISREVKDLRMLDSVVLWARGDGFMLVALENRSVFPEIKTWKQIPLTNTWTRYRIRPGDFDDPGPGGNVGWYAVRTTINTLSVFALGGTELWVDDIELYGIYPPELR